MSSRADPGGRLALRDSRIVVTDVGDKRGRSTIWAAPVDPCRSGFSKSRLPIGLQLIDRPLGEAMLRRMAAAFERETRRPDRKPAQAQ